MASLVLAESLVGLLARTGCTVATAESCTGGLIAAAITAIPGASAVFTQGVISYANDAKVSLLGVTERMLADHGAVSEPVARAMAEGIRHRANTDLAIATTGIAGPGGGSAAKPVGLVYVAVVSRHKSDIREYHFSGNRAEIRAQTVDQALIFCREILERDALAPTAG